MKVVINTCHGGFSLSHKGEQRYLELSGQRAYWYVMPIYSRQEFIRVDNIDDIKPIHNCWCTTSDQGAVLYDYPDDVFYSRKLERNDPILVQVVKELGKDASSPFSNLEVVDIEKGRWFKIDEYDGYENIQYRDIDDEWILAD